MIFGNKNRILWEKNNKIIFVDDINDFMGNVNNRNFFCIFRYDLFIFIDECLFKVLVFNNVYNMIVF